MEDSHAWSARTRKEPGAGLVNLIGVAAQQYSGLTGCAFGALARNAIHMGGWVTWALRNDRLDYLTLAGTMELAPHEPPRSVNRDWLAALRTADYLDPQDKNDMFKDKIRITELNRMLSICMRDRIVIMLLLRNNAGRVGTVVWTFMRSYFALLVYEKRRLILLRRAKYLKGVFSGVISVPTYLKGSLALLVQAGRIKRKQQGRPISQ